jgi:hypothetical protein
MHRGVRLSHRTSACVGLCGVSRKGEPSSAFEQIGGLCKLVRPTADGSVDEMTLNVEYNQLDSVRPASQSRRGCAVGQQGTHTSCAVWRGWPTTSDPPCVPHRKRACAAPTCDCCRALRACVDGATDPRVRAALVVRRSCPACVCEPQGPWGARCSGSEGVGAAVRQRFALQTAARPRPLRAAQCTLRLTMGVQHGLSHGALLCTFARRALCGVRCVLSPHGMVWACHSEP